MRKQISAIDFDMTFNQVMEGGSLLRKNIYPLKPGQPSIQTLRGGVFIDQMKHLIRCSSSWRRRRTQS